MKKTILIMTLMMTVGQVAAVGEMTAQPRNLEYYGWCDVEGCQAAAIHAHDGRICLPGSGHYGAYNNAENYDSSGNYNDSGNYGSYHGYHHSQYRGGHHH